jgi:hypothetical protein
LYTGSAEEARSLFRPEGGGGIQVMLHYLTLHNIPNHTVRFDNTPISGVDRLGKHSYFMSNHRELRRNTNNAHRVDRFTVTGTAFSCH